MLDPAAKVVDVVAPENGMSSESILFDVDVNGAVDHYVARLAPLPSLVPVFQHYDIQMQADAMRLVGERTDLPVPEVPFVELDESFLQVPFLVMKRSSGRYALTRRPAVRLRGWVADLSADERLLMQRNAVDTLVKLHEIRPDNADLSFLVRPEHGAERLDQHLGHQRGYYEWARDGRALPADRTHVRRGSRPTGRAGEPVVLNWGDARIGNMIYAGTAPVAVLDWEMAAVGPARSIWRG